MANICTWQFNWQFKPRRNTTTPSFLLQKNSRVDTREFFCNKQVGLFRMVTKIRTPTKNSQVYKFGIFLPYLHTWLILYHRVGCVNHRWCNSIKKNTNIQTHIFIHFFESPNLFLKPLLHATTSNVEQLVGNSLLTALVICQSEFAQQVVSVVSSHLHSHNTSGMFAC